MITGLLVIGRHALLRLAQPPYNILPRHVTRYSPLKAMLRALMTTRLIIHPSEESLEALRLQRPPHRDPKSLDLTGPEEGHLLRSLILARASPPFRTSPLKALKGKRSNS